MRCGRAQRLMAAAVDGELVARRRRAFQRHVTSCSGCRDELDVTKRLLEEVGELSSERTVPVRLEQATLRRVRVLAAEEAERPAARRRWWAALGAPALAAASVAVVVLAVGLYRTTGVPDRTSRTAPAAASRSVPKHTPAPQVARRARPERLAQTVPPEPPPALAAVPDLFVDLPILRNMEKLQHFDAISTTTLDDRDQSNG